MTPPLTRAGTSTLKSKAGSKSTGPVAVNDQVNVNVNVNVNVYRRTGMGSGRGRFRQRAVSLGLQRFADLGRQEDLVGVEAG